MAEDFEVRVKFIPDFGSGGLGGGAKQAGAGNSEDDTSRIMRTNVKPVMALLLKRLLMGGGVTGLAGGIATTGITKVLTDPKTWAGVGKTVGIAAGVAIAAALIGKGVTSLQNKTYDSYEKEKEETGALNVGPETRVGDVVDKIKGTTFGPGDQSRKDMLKTLTTDLDDLKKNGIQSTDLAMHKWDGTLDRNRKGILGIVDEVKDLISGLFGGSDAIKDMSDSTELLTDNLQDNGLALKDVGQVVGDMISNNSKHYLNFSDLVKTSADRQVSDIMRVTRALEKQKAVQHDLRNVISKASSRGQTINSSGISGGGRPSIGFSDAFAEKFAAALMEPNSG